MGVLKSERETHMWAASDEDEWQICTEDKKMITLLINRGWNPVSTKVAYMTTYMFVLPRKAISIRSEKSVRNPKSRGKGGLNK